MNIEHPALARRAAAHNAGAQIVSLTKRIEKLENGGVSNDTQGEIQELRAAVIEQREAMNVLSIQLAELSEMVTSPSEEQPKSAKAPEVKDDESSD